MSGPELSVRRERIENCDRDAVDELIELAGERGDRDELRRLADQGNTDGAEVLAELTAE